MAVRSSAQHAAQNALLAGDGGTSFASYELLPKMADYGKIIGMAKNPRSKPPHSTRADAPFSAPLDPLENRSTSVTSGAAPLGLRCAVYHRVSTLDQDATLADRELHAHATRIGGQVVMAAHEHASGAGVERPEFDKLMAAAKAGLIDAVLVWKLDRFGRSTLDLLANIRALEACGVRFVAVTQGLDIRPGSDAISKLLLTMLAAVAEFERDLIRERTRLGLASARRRGQVLGRPRGSVNAAEVKRLRAEGMSWSAVADKLKCTVASARRRAAE